MVNNSLAFLLCGTARIIIKKMDRLIAHHGITLQQAMMLDAIHSYGGEQLNQISVRLMLDRTTMTRNTATLVARGWVTPINLRDNRCKSYALTKAGLEMMAVSRDLIHEAESDLEEQLDFNLYHDTRAALHDLSIRLQQ